MSAVYEHTRGCHGHRARVGTGSSLASHSPRRRDASHWFDLSGLLALLQHLDDPQACGSSDNVMRLMERAVSSSHDASPSTFLTELFVAPLHKAIVLAEVGCEPSVASAAPLPALVVRSIQLLRAVATRGDGVASLRPSHLQRCFRRRRVWAELGMHGSPLRVAGTPLMSTPRGNSRRGSSVKRVAPNASMPCSSAAAATPVWAAARPELRFR